MTRHGSASGLTRVDLSLLMVPVIWGVNYAVIKAALLEFQPLAFNGLRFTLATFTIWVLLLHRGTSLRIPREGLLSLVLLGVLGNTVYQLLFIEGVALTTAANASLIMASVPMLVAVLATALRRERLLGRGWVGVALTVGGLVLLLSAREGGGYVGGTLLGDLLMLAAGGTWALYTVLASSVMARNPHLPATLITFLSGTPVLLLVAIPSFISQDWRAVGVKGWAGVVFSGVVAIGLAYLIWNTGLGAIGGTRTAAYSNLTPLVAATLSWLTLGERWSPGQFIGAVTVLGGLALTRKGMAPHAGVGLQTSEVPQTQGRVG
jgi:drug/metabolite transporter (DMT)-like permease